MMFLENSSENSSVTVRAPATTANLGPGFDCIGLALDLWNEVTLTASQPLRIGDSPLETSYSLNIEGIDSAKIPHDRQNLLIKATEHLFQLAGHHPEYLKVHMINRIPVGSGLGSSSSVIVAGLLGANALLNCRYSREELLRIAVEIEGHPDNVAPAMLGGLVLGVQPDVERGPADLIIKPLGTPDLKAVVVLPDIHLPTSEARAVLPDRVDRREAIFNTSRFGLLIYSLISGDYKDLGLAMGDMLHQPYRLALVPGAAAAIHAGYEAGALGVALSGAGPSLIAFTSADNNLIAPAMRDAFQSAGLECRHWVLSLSPAGANVIASTQNNNSD
ncbi:MAG: homoserine kinase [Chloroflexota bacterium]